MKHTQYSDPSKPFLRTRQEETLQEMDRKRKSAEVTTDEFDDDRLTLRLSPPTANPEFDPRPPSPPVLTLGPPSNSRPHLRQRPSPLQLLPLSADIFLPPSFLQLQPPAASGTPLSPESSEPEEGPPPQRPAARSKRNLIPGNGKLEKIDPPYPWSADRRAAVLPLDALLARGIAAVYGEVLCRRCDYKAVMQHEVRERFAEVAAKVAGEKEGMRGCAPAEWMNPRFPPCPSCEQENCMRPVVAGKKREINWLFMLLGQTIGTCTVEQLRYFCKHHRKHRTGSKSRVLYATYLGLCRQLDPKGPFDD